MTEWAKNMMKNAIIKIPLIKQMKEILHVKFADLIRYLKKNINKLNFKKAAAFFAKEID